MDGFLAGDGSVGIFLIIIMALLINIRCVLTSDSCQDDQRKVQQCIEASPDTCTKVRYVRWVGGKTCFCQTENGRLEFDLAEKYQ